MPPIKVDESNIPIYFWAFLLVFIVVYVAIADTWLHSHGHEYMTTEFREGLRTSWGPMLTCLWFGVIIGLSAHFYFYKP